MIAQPKPTVIVPDATDPGPHPCAAPARFIKIPGRRTVSRIESDNEEPMQHRSTMMRPRRILITGSSGFIGSQLVRRFRDRGWQVVGIGRRPLTDAGYLVHDLARPLPVSCEGDFDVVIHAAARSNPWGTRRQYQHDNVDATRNVLNHCRVAGLPRLIFISSSSVYYRPQHQLGIVEETPLPDRAVNRYAATKRMAEDLVREYPGEWAILRPRAVYGPGDTVLLPRILRAARAGRLPLLQAPDGPVVGDLIYIDNLVDAIEAAATQREAVGIFNLTNDAPVGILDFLSEILHRLKIPPPTRRVSASSAMAIAGCLEAFHRIFLPRVEPVITRFGVHVFRFSKTFNVAKAKRVLGPPRVGNAESIERTVDWFRVQPEFNGST